MNEPRPRSPFISPKLVIHRAAHGSGLVAAEPIAAGEILVRYPRELVTEASRYSIQIDAERHLAPSGEAGDLVNHGCAPNCHLDVAGTAAPALVALTPIAAGDELRFNYLTTEWDLAEPFECRCGAAECVGTVRGFRHLSRAERARIAALLSPFLRDRLDEE